MHTIVILGTGTGVGKTYVTSAILDLLTSQFSGTVMGLKPVESGISLQYRSDAAILALHSRPTLAPQHAFPLRAPLSPHLAAGLEQKEISVNAIVDWLHGRTSTIRSPNEPNVKWLVVETAGGVFSPLNPMETNASLAKALDPCLWVLVAPDRLGVLHDLTATLIALEKVARRPDIVLLDTPETSDSSTGTNRKEIERLQIAEITGVLPRNAGLNSADKLRFIERLKSQDSPTWPSE